MGKSESGDCTRVHPECVNSCWNMEISGRSLMFADKKDEKAFVQRVLPGSVKYTRIAVVIFAAAPIVRGVIRIQNDRTQSPADMQYSIFLSISGLLFILASFGKFFIRYAKLAVILFLSFVGVAQLWRVATETVDLDDDVYDHANGMIYLLGFYGVAGYIIPVFWASFAPILVGLLVSDVILAFVYEREHVKAILPITAFLLIVSLIFGRRMELLLRRSFCDSKSLVTSEVLLKAAQGAAEKVKVQATLMAKMSHELRNPINGILGAVELISHEYHQGREIKDVAGYINTIFTSARSLLTVVDQSLNVVRNQSQQFVPEIKSIKPSVMARRVTDSCRVRAEKKSIEVVSYVDSMCPKNMFGDRSRIMQVLLNFSTNAAKYSSDGSILLEILMVPEGESYFRGCLLGCMDKEFPRRHLSDRDMKKMYRTMGSKLVKGAIDYGQIIYSASGGERSVDGVTGDRTSATAMGTSTMANIFGARAFLARRRSSDDRDGSFAHAIAEDAGQAIEHGRTASDTNVEVESVDEPVAYRGKRVVFRVTDNGKGIAKDHIHNAFKTFVQMAEDRNTPESDHGVGLGLSIARELVLALGGDIGVRSARGVGSCFVCGFPVRKENHKYMLGKVTELGPGESRELRTVDSMQLLTEREVDVSGGEASDLDTIRTQDSRRKGSMRDSWVTDVPHRRSVLLSKRTLPRLIVMESVPEGSVASTAVSDLGSSHSDGSKSDHSGKDGTFEIPNSENKIRVLVADDNPINLALLCKFMEKLGDFETRTASDGLQAFEAIKVAVWEGSPFSLFLVDNHMPVISGDALVEQLRERESKRGSGYGVGGKSLSIIGISGDAPAGELSDAGFDGWLQKPISLQVFRQLVKNILESSP